jgi:hypothetical protein
MVQRLVSYVSTWQELGYIRFFLYNRLLNFNGHIDHLGITLKYRHWLSGYEVRAEILVFFFEVGSRDKSLTMQPKLA